VGLIGQVQIDRRARPTLVVNDLERATAKHRPIDIGPDPDALRADVNPGLRQQKHQQPEIDDSKNDKQPLSLHGFPLERIAVLEIPSASLTRAGLADHGNLRRDRSAGRR
jgi:hypothetical protein